MNELDNRKILPDGTVICHQEAMIELLYEGKGLGNILCVDSDDQTEWETALRLCDATIEGPQHADLMQFQDINWFDYWLTPEPWKSIDVHTWCLKHCKTQIERDRIDYEMEQYKQRNMEPIFRHLLYCVDVWRKNGVVWGVGRGSSVCSFVLHLIGINRINPLEYGLDIKEWLK